MTLPLDSTVDLIGLLLLALGVFLILSGLGIFSVQQVSVQKGKKTWIVGLFFVIIGGVVLFPELVPDTSSTNLTEDTSKGEWEPIDFNIPTETIWYQKTENSYTATGNVDTFAWSTEVYEGNFTIELEVESLSPDGEATIIVNGDGKGFSKGSLIFTITQDWQSIRAHTVYEGVEELFSNNKIVDIKSRMLTMTVEIDDNYANLYVDGEKVASALLDNDINRRGRIGLYKYWERPAVTFSNIQIQRP